MIPDPAGTFGYVAYGASQWCRTAIRDKKAGNRRCGLPLAHVCSGRIAIEPDEKKNRQRDEPKKAERESEPHRILSDIPDHFGLAATACREHDLHLHLLDGHGFEDDETAAEYFQYGPCLEHDGGRRLSFQ